MVTGRKRRLPTVSRDRQVAWRAGSLAWSRTVRDSIAARRLLATFLTAALVCARIPVSVVHCQCRVLREPRRPNSGLRDREPMREAKRASRLGSVGLIDGACWRCLLTVLDSSRFALLERVRAARVTP
jgi:hypothetical protein